ncbi:MAG TPA: JAB domain-containing protein, partial [Fibrobacteraceae bacterium]|nr:JAB domain-containing protein [Fibrobacteraceae bacterium]
MNLMNPIEKSKPRERLVRDGVSKISDEELISIIIGHGTNKKSVFELSKELFSFLRTIKNTPTVYDLEKISGLGRAKACQILACLELSNRFLLSGEAQTITHPHELVPRLAFLKSLSQETMVCVHLNGANRVMGIHTLTVGLVNQTQIHPREAFSRAIQENAVSVIFAHNHPSGSLQPSR